jgi:hypothetical protein
MVHIPFQNQVAHEFGWDFFFFIAIGITIAVVNKSIYGYAKNFDMAVQNENSALIGVAGGNLGAHVPVSRNDEFGVSKMVAIYRQ